MTKAEWVEKWSQYLQNSGHRLTAPRRAVLQTLAQTTVGLNPKEILTQVQRQHAHTGLVTVYRTLEVLSQCGAVRKLHQLGDCNSYAPALAEHAHHILCEKCQAIMEFEGCDLHGLFARVQQYTGYRVQDHWLELKGTCPQCQSATRRGTRNAPRNRRRAPRAIG